jgi:ribosomal-protein-alanine N-acetyltransferase
LVASLPASPVVASEPASTVVASGPASPPLVASARASGLASVSLVVSGPASLDPSPLASGRVASASAAPSAPRASLVPPSARGSGSPASGSVEVLDEHAAVASTAREAPVKKAKRASRGRIELRECLISVAEERGEGGSHRASLFRGGAYPPFRAMSTLVTARLELRPVTLAIAVAILEGRRREEIEAVVHAEMPWAWPGRALLEQVFNASLDAIRADPETRLWGDRLMVTREGPPRVVGSIVFHGRPGADGTCEVSYGVEEASQNRGYATEALTACLAWALAQPECKVIEATTMAWHKGSARVLEKVGMKRAGTRRRDGSGEMLVYEIRREG